MKTYHQQYGIGRAKYTVSFCDGVQTHKDGSRFYGIAIFRNKRKLAKFLKGLHDQGYVEKPHYA